MKVQTPHTRILNDQTLLPLPGYGTAGMRDRKDLSSVIRTAIEAGYRHIDTASKYGSEEAVGQAIRDCGLPRKDLYIVTKIWTTDMRAHREREALTDSLRRLGMDYVDQFLIHWPVAGEFLRTWKEVEKLKQDGYIRSIGVSNFQPHHLDVLMHYSDTVPVVNQVECHPLLNQEALQVYCEKNGILLTCHSPLGGAQGGNLTDDPALKRIGTGHGKSAAQVILRWHVQHGRIPLPRSSNSGRMRENLALFDFTLSDEEMARIDAMNRNTRFGAHPDTFDF